MVLHCMALHFTALYCILTYQIGGLYCMGLYFHRRLIEVRGAHWDFTLLPSIDDDDDDEVDDVDDDQLTKTMMKKMANIPLII